MLGAFSTWQLARLNLDVGFWDLFWPQAIQGFGLSMVFVPLTTISMNPVPREAMGNATSLFNLMRNLGGSVGIAVVAMMNTRFQQKYTAILGEHVRQRKRRSRNRWFGSLRSMFLSTGSGPGLADQRAYASSVRNGAAASRDAGFRGRLSVAHCGVSVDDSADADHEEAEGGGGPGPAAH